MPRNRSYFLLKSGPPSGHEALPSQESFRSLQIECGAFEAVFSGRNPSASRLDSKKQAYPGFLCVQRSINANRPDVRLRVGLPQPTPNRRPKADGVAHNGARTATLQRGVFFRVNLGNPFLHPLGKVSGYRPRVTSGVVGRAKPDAAPCRGAHIDCGRVRKRIARALLPSTRKA